LSFANPEKRENRPAAQAGGERKGKKCREAIVGPQLGKTGSIAGRPRDLGPLGSGGRSLGVVQSPTQGVGPVGSLPTHRVAKKNKGDRNKVRLQCRVWKGIKIHAPLKQSDHQVNEGKKFGNKTLNRNSDV